MPSCTPLRRVFVLMDESTLSYGTCAFLVDEKEEEATVMAMMALVTVMVMVMVTAIALR
jgi:hypothetical protein